MRCCVSWLPRLAHALIERPRVRQNVVARAWWNERDGMSRIVLAVFVLLLLIVAGGMLFLGAFPPQPRTEQVERILPNNRFAPKP